jgi:hypothetical protein
MELTNRKTFLPSGFFYAFTLPQVPVSFKPVHSQRGLIPRNLLARGRLCGGEVHSGVLEQDQLSDIFRSGGKTAAK